MMIPEGAMKAMMGCLILFGIGLGIGIILMIWGAVEVWGHGEGQFLEKDGGKYEISHFIPGREGDPSGVSDERYQEFARLLFLNDLWRVVSGHGHRYTKNGKLNSWSYWNAAGYQIVVELGLGDFIDDTEPKPKPKPPKPVPTPNTDTDTSTPTPEPPKPKPEPPKPEPEPEPESPPVPEIHTGSFTHQHDDFVLHLHTFRYTGNRLSDDYYHGFMNHDEVTRIVPEPEPPKPEPEPEPESPPVPEIHTGSFTHQHDDFVLHLHTFRYTGNRLSDDYYHGFMNHDEVTRIVPEPEPEPKPEPPKPKPEPPQMEETDDSRPSPDSQPGGNEETEAEKDEETIEEETESDEDGTSTPLEPPQIVYPRPPRRYDSYYQVSLEVPKGISLFHVPLSVDGVTHISDIFELLEHKVIFIYALENQEWVLYWNKYWLYDNGDRAFSQNEAFIVVMAEAVSLEIIGKALHPELRIREGINLVGVPRKVDLLRVYDVSLIISWANGGWAYGSRPRVHAGQGFIIIADNDFNVYFSSSSWGDVK